MFDKFIFCSTLKQLRTKKELTQSDVATVFGLKKQYISRWEKGDTEPNLTQLCALADYFDVSVDYLLGRTDEMR